MCHFCMSRYGKCQVMRKVAVASCPASSDIVRMSDPMSLRPFVCAGLVGRFGGKGRLRQIAGANGRRGSVRSLGFQQCEGHGAHVQWLLEVRFGHQLGLQDFFRRAVFDIALNEQHPMSPLHAVAAQLAASPGAETRHTAFSSQPASRTSTLALPVFLTV